MTFTCLLVYLQRCMLEIAGALCNPLTLVAETVCSRCLARKGGARRDIELKQVDWYTLLWLSQGCHRLEDALLPLNITLLPFSSTKYRQKGLRFSVQSLFFCPLIAKFFPASG